jgi:hypothetical protein
MPPSRPMDPPDPIVMSEERNLTTALRKGNRPSPATTTSSRLLDRWGPANRSPQYNTNPAHKAAYSRRQHPLPILHDFGHLYEITRAPQEQILNRFGCVNKKADSPVHQLPRRLLPEANERPSSLNRSFSRIRKARWPMRRMYWRRSPRAFEFISNRTAQCYGQTIL